MEKTYILGVKVNNLSMDETLEEMNRLIKSGGSHLLVTLGVEMVMAAQKDEEFKSIVNDASLVVPDSVGIIWAAKRAGKKLRERVPGVEIIDRVAATSDKYDWKAFFLGAKPGVAREAAEKLESKYPNFKWVGEHHGYFKDDGEILEKINKTKPNLIFVAMGFPAQEKWFIKHREKLGNSIVIGVGGSFDVISGRIKRAPIFYRKLGLEWFHRLITEPKRIVRMMALPLFVLNIIFKGVQEK